jgi:hypothetical protein
MTIQNLVEYLVNVSKYIAVDYTNVVSADVGDLLSNLSLFIEKACHETVDAEEEDDVIYEEEVGDDEETQIQITDELSTEPAPKPAVPKFTAPQPAAWTYMSEESVSALVSGLSPEDRATAEAASRHAMETIVALLQKNSNAGSVALGPTPSSVVSEVPATPQTHVPGTPEMWGRLDLDLAEYQAQQAAAAERREQAGNYDHWVDQEEWNKPTHPCMLVRNGGEDEEDDEEDDDEDELELELAPSAPPPPPTPPPRTSSAAGKASISRPTSSGV